MKSERIPTLYALRYSNSSASFLFNFYLNKETGMLFYSAIKKGA
jgi:hypothetical protein